jgi:hypothetical protein
MTGGWTLVVIWIIGVHFSCGRIPNLSQTQCERDGREYVRIKRITSYHCFPPRFLKESG